MNNSEIAFLMENWERVKEMVWKTNHMHDLDIAGGCFAIFGTVGVTVWKFSKGAWRSKTVNYWKELSFRDFMAKFKEAEWENE